MKVLLTVLTLALSLSASADENIVSTNALIDECVVRYEATQTEVKGYCVGNLQIAVDGVAKDQKIIIAALSHLTHPADLKYIPQTGSVKGCLISESKFLPAGCTFEPVAEVVTFAPHGQVMYQR